MQATAANTNSTSFPMHAIYPGGEGNYNLNTTGFNNPDPYKATTSDMPLDSDYSTYETPASSCTADYPFSLVGYSTGNTLTDAAGASVTATVPNFTNLTSDKFVIVWNKTCPPVPVHLSPANNSSLTTATWLSADWSDVTDPSSPVSYIYESSNSQATNVDGSFITPAYVSGSLSTSEIPTPGTPEGVYYWHVRAVDSVGNQSAWSTPWKVTVDDTAPTVDLVFSGTGPSVTGFKAVFSEDVKQSEAENPANYFLNNWPGAGGSGDLVGDATIVYDSPTRTATVSFTNPSWYISPEQQWGVRDIHDLAGNLQQVNPYTEYSTPLVAPVTTDSGTDSNWHNTSVTVNFSCTDTNGSGCKKTYYTTDGTDPTASSSFGNSVTLNAEGIYTIKYFSVDNAGNEEGVNTASNTVKIDKTAPTITVDSLSTTDHTPQLTGSIDDNSAVLNIAVNGNVYTGINNGNGTWTLADDTIAPALSDGIYDVSASATDTAGNIGHDSTTNELTVTTPAVLAATTTGGGGGAGDGLGCGSHDCSSNAAGGGASPTTPAVLGLAIGPSFTNLPALAQVGGEQGVQTESNGEVLGTKSANPTFVPTSTQGQNPGAGFVGSLITSRTTMLLVLLFIAGLLYYLYRRFRKK